MISASVGDRSVVGVPASLGVPVAVLTAAAVVGTILTDWRAGTPALVVLVVALGAASAMDLAHRRVPNQLVGWTTVLVLALLLAALPWSGGTPLLRGLMGGVVLFAIFWFVHSRAPSRFGAGDVKLAFVAGLGASWSGVGQLTWLMVWTGVGLLATAAVFAVRGRSLGGVIPFVPVLSAATALTIVLGQWW